ncbi:MAG: hypothetical protein ACLPHP_05865 [Candidatus Sulfotelmatobacter sp.]
MKGFLPISFFLLLSLSASALEDGHAKYVGGTVAGVTAGTVGRLDTTSEASLIFVQAGNKLEIPYASIESYEYSKEVTWHLGVLPTIVVGLVKVRQRRHFFRFSYRDSNHVVQAAVFEVPKQMPRTLQAVLQTRAAQSRKPCRACAKSK